jgi:SPP1 family holin
MNVKASTIIRTIVLAVVLVNNILTMNGLNPLPFSEDELYEIVSGIATIAASIWAWWENNSFTKAAIKADEEYERIKAEEKEGYDA